MYKKSQKKTYKKTYQHRKAMLLCLVHNDFPVIVNFLFLLMEHLMTGDHGQFDTFCVFY